MPNNAKERIISFIKQALREPMMDFSPYADEAFCKALKLRALEDLSFILFKIHHDYTRAHQKKIPFDLQQELNTPHPETHLRALDYCLAAGLDEMATRLSSLGAKSEHGQFFHTNLNNFYKDQDETPDIVTDIHAIFSKVTLTQADMPTLIPTNHINLENPYWEKFKLVLKDPKFSGLLLAIALTTGIVSLIFPAVSATLLLISMTVTSILPIIKVYQDTHSKLNSVIGTVTVDEQAQQDQEIRDLIELSSSMKSALRLELHDLTNKNKLAKHVSSIHDTETLLFDFLSKHGALEELKSHMELSSLNPRPMQDP